MKRVGGDMEIYEEVKCTEVGSHLAALVMRMVTDGQRQSVRFIRLRFNSFHQAFCLATNNDADLAHLCATTSENITSETSAIPKM